MEKGLSTALVIGVLLNLTKGADMILLDSQKKYLQTKVESFTIFLDHINPIKWYDIFTTMKAQFILLVIGVLEFSIVSAVALAQGNQEVNDKEWQIFQYLALGIGLLGILFSVKFVGLKVSRWLVELKSSFRFIGRYLKMVLLGFLFFGVYVFITMLVIRFFSHQPSFDDAMDQLEKENSLERHIFMTFMLLVWPIFALFFVLVEAFGLLVWISVAIIIVELIVKIFRGLMRRIVQYNKGAFSAIILIITVCLGVYAVFIKK